MKDDKLPEYTNLWEISAELSSGISICFCLWIVHSFEWYGLWIWESELEFANCLHPKRLLLHRHWSDLHRIRGVTCLWLCIFSGFWTYLLQWTFMKCKLFILSYERMKMGQLNYHRRLSWYSLVNSNFVKWKLPAAAKSIIFDYLW